MYCPSKIWQPTYAKLLKSLFIFNLYIPEFSCWKQYGNYFVTCFNFLASDTYYISKQAQNWQIRGSTNKKTLIFGIWQSSRFKIISLTELSKKITKIFMEVSAAIGVWKWMPNITIFNAMHWIVWQYRFWSFKLKDIV